MPKTGNRTYKKGGQIHNQNTVKHGVYRADRHLVHDKRTAIAKMILQFQETLIEALGGADAISPQQKLILDRLSFKAVRCVLAETAMIQSNGNTADSLSHNYLRWSHSLREDLKLLGMKRVPKEIQSVKEYVAETYGSEVEKQ